MKIHLFGASGSGVTTLGEALAARLHLPYFDSDTYFWHHSDPPFTNRRSPADRNQLILEDLDKADNWILGGSIINWGENMFPPFDLIVFLYLPQEIRIDRLKKREFQRYGEVLLTNAKRQKLFNDFISWASDYDNPTGKANRTLQAHKTWLAKIKQPVLELHGDHTVEERLEKVIGKLQQEKLLPLL